MSIFNRILVPTDFDQPSERALEVAIEMARQLDASVTLVHVYRLPSYSYYAGAWPTELAASLRKATRDRLDQVMAKAQQALPNVRSVLCEGEAWQAILAEPKLGADLLLVGTHGRRGLNHALLGSVAEKLVRMSPVPVLTLRVPEAQACARAG